MEIKLKELLFFVTAFIIFTPIGTISHECGHVIAAKMRGYETALHYSSTNWNAEATKKKLEILYLENEEAISKNEPFADKSKMEQLASELKKDSLFITSAGPVQTMLTGIIGLLLLHFRRKFIRLHGLKPMDWLGVFLSLFWLREVFNVLNSIRHTIFNGAESFFGGDEAIVSLMLRLPAGTIPIICGLAGIVVSSYVLFKIIPRQKRFSFAIGGILGGFSGLYIWMRLLGPTLLP